MRRPSSRLWTCRTGWHAGARRIDQTNRPDQRPRKRGAEMPKQSNWAALTHTDKLTVLRDTALEQILADYKNDDLDERAFRELLTREKALWQAHLYDAKETIKGKPPNKEVVLGAWRDLDRSEAILELIDNSIDAWKRRRRQYPDKTAPE